MAFYLFLSRTVSGPRLFLWLAFFGSVAVYVMEQGSSKTCFREDTGVVLSVSWFVCVCVAGSVVPQVSG